MSCLKKLIQRRCGQITVDAKIPFQWITGWLTKEKVTFGLLAGWAKLSECEKN